MPPRRTSKRASAGKANELFKKLQDEDELTDYDEEPATSKVQRNGLRSTKRRKKNDVQDDNDEDFEPQNEEDIPFVEVVEEFACEEELAYEEEQTDTILDANALQRIKRDIILFWGDYIIMPNPQLRELPKGITTKWKTNEQNKKTLSCPRQGCGKTFGTAAGLIYHYKRCGVDSNPKAVCKLCGHSDSPAKKLIPHIVKNHSEEVPEVPDELKPGLVFKERSGYQKRRLDKDGGDDLGEAEEYRREMEISSGVFPKLIPKKTYWEPLSATTATAALPSTKKSASFRNNSKANWRTLNLFEVSNDKYHSTFFCGGVCWSSAWVPFPTKIDSSKEDSVIALGVAPKFDSNHTFVSQEEQGLIQFWSFGKLGQDRTSSSLDPKILFCLSHTYGVIWKMEFCPFGNTWMPMNSVVARDQYPRLGLLALACGDGYVRILSIPHPDPIIKMKGKRRSSNQLVFKAHPVIICDPLGVGPLTDDLGTICRSLSWSKSHNHQYIAGGYGSGVISLWNLETTSEFLVDKNSTIDCKILLPQRSFIAHESAVVSLDFCPLKTDKLILASGGHEDRNVLLWDLTDMSGALSFCDGSIVDSRMYGSLINDVAWMFRWGTLLVGMDDAFTNKNTSVTVFDAREPASRYMVSRHRGTVWCLSYNEWSNSEASVDAAGEATVYLNFLFLLSRSSNRRSRSERFPLYHIQLKRLKEDGNKENMKSSSSGKVDAEVHHTYAGISKIFGIEFSDFDTTDTSKIPKQEIDRLRSFETMQWFHPSNYPLVSLNQVRWNPNKHSYTWIFTAGHSGLCRLTCYSILKTCSSNGDEQEEDAE